MAGLVSFTDQTDLHLARNMMAHFQEGRAQVPVFNTTGFPISVSAELPFCTVDWLSSDASPKTHPFRISAVQVLPNYCG